MSARLAIHTDQGPQNKAMNSATSAIAVPVSPASPAAEHGFREGTNPFTIAGVVGLSAFMEVLDISIANVSLRNIAGGLAAGQDESTWILTSYLVANAIVLPITGWLSAMFGRTSFYMVSIALFTLSSLMCGLAPSLPLLIFFRIIQGLGGGALQPVSQAIMSDAFPPEKRTIAFAMYGMAVVAAPAIGPTLGGWITDTYSWHWIFLLNVPIGLVLLVLVKALIRDPRAFVEMREKRQREGFRIDYFGFALIAIGLGSLQIMLDKGQQDDWLSSDFIAWMAVIAVVSLTVAVIWEWRHKDPMVNLRLLKSRNFSVGMVLMFALGFILLSSTLLLPLLTQSLLGYTATDAGLVISPGGAVIVLMMPVVGIISSKFDPRALIIFGLLTLSAAMYYMTTLDLAVDYKTLAIARMYQSFGLAFMFIPINAMAYVGLPPEQSGNASALVNLARNIGGSVGTSLVTTLLARSAAAHQVTLGAHVSRLDPHYTQTLKGLAARFGNDAAGQQQANGLIAEMVGQQASMLSYIDVFQMLSIGALLIIPLAFLLKRGTGAPPPGVH
jgi:DHA2 family multidrug resistance protein